MTKHTLAGAQLPPAPSVASVGPMAAIRSLSLRGAPVEVLRLARRLLLASSVVELALNAAEPLIVSEVGKALFDAVGPLFLIDWAEVGLLLLQASATGQLPVPPTRTVPWQSERARRWMLSCWRALGMRTGGVVSVSASGICRESP